MTQATPTRTNPAANAPDAVGASSCVKSKSGMKVQGTATAPLTHWTAPLALVVIVAEQKTVPPLTLRRLCSRLGELL